MSTPSTNPTLYVRNTESNAVRQLTPEQAARCEFVVNNNYKDTAGAITGTIFGGDVNDAGGHTVYSLTFDRWYDPNNYANAAAADEAFAAQGEKSHTEPAQWWTDPTTTTTKVPAPAAPAAAPVAPVPAGAASADAAVDLPGRAAGEELGGGTEGAPLVPVLMHPSIAAELKAFLKKLAAGANGLAHTLKADAEKLIAHIEHHNQ